jgi:hypothetical protein
MAAETIGFEEMMGYIHRGEIRLWTLNSDVSGELAHSHRWGLHIYCGEGPQEKPSKIKDEDLLKYENNGISKLFIFRKQDGLGR